MNLDGNTICQTKGSEMVLEVNMAHQVKKCFWSGYGPLGKEMFFGSGYGHWLRSIV